MLDYVCTWVHMMEDARISEFFWGNELVVTSGLLMENDDKFVENLRILLAKECVGVVVNTGPYISELSDKIIAFCEENHLPLLSMPWNRSMTEFTRTCCNQIARGTLNDERLAEAVIQVTRSPQEHVAEIEELGSHFNAENGLMFLSIDINLETEHHKYNHENQLRIGTAMRGYNFPFLVFMYERHFIILFNQNDAGIAGEAAARIMSSVKMGFPTSEVHIGIGEPVTDMFRLNLAFQTAQAARRHAILKQEDVTQFSSIGFLKLFYTVSDTSVLRSYYSEIMKPLIEYEKGGNKDGIFTETLFRYLLSDGSIKEVAAAMYVHENTILYRMNKIRTILGCSLATQKERQPYLMAYYCGVILRLVPEYD